MAERGAVSVTVQLNLCMILDVRGNVVQWLRSLTSEHHS